MVADPVMVAAGDEEEGQHIGISSETRKKNDIWAICQRGGRRAARRVVRAWEGSDDERSWPEGLAGEAVGGIAQGRVGLVATIGGEVGVE